MSMGAHTSMKKRRLPNLPGCFPSLIFPINGSIIPSHTLLISMMTLTQYMGMPTVSVKKGTNKKVYNVEAAPSEYIAAGKRKLVFETDLLRRFLDR